ncbi:MAG: hypothetical protein A2942_02300 [Candidatus Lloydbacteria bacterium RIFCSPLOWO2_01_FULL_50_20]|uniref:Phosphoribosyltransferase domain-containing protein n=1 Tax=Candidatus Lloydbacteria bacterium RIFCSPLOWO2_01_FULL_50_20 TaxID=1798665 RepID=A0A1G2DEG7_9BACT|nr:MAG: hypothetical protein A2942_02300 [Candidatus Lloydbacteria bacterium RIFCSPLOWO2_01_FULL_50_20]
MLEDFLTLLFPEHCIGCNKTGSALCAICERSITVKAHALGTTVATLFDYQNPLVKRALWALKYHRKRSLGKYFGIALYREFFKSVAQGNTRPKEAIVLVPVPSGKRALRLRGYNHSGVIAAAIVQAAKADGLVLELEANMLFKKRENEQQVEARTKTKRSENVAHVFGVRTGERIAGKTVVLVDDVITTGATIAEAKRALSEWKPRRILTVAVAH